MEEQEPHDEDKEESKRTAGLVLGFLLGFLISAPFLRPIFCPTPGLPTRHMCESNLSGIGKGLVLYQAENKDISPPNLHTVALEVGLKIFVCPRAGTKYSPTTAPADFREHCDYIFTLCSQAANLPPYNLLCGYELPLNHDQKYVNRLYYDMHTAGARNMNEFRVEVQKVNNLLAEKRGGGL